MSDLHVDQLLAFHNEQTTHHVTFRQHLLRRNLSIKYFLTAPTPTVSVSFDDEASVLAATSASALDSRVSKFKPQVVPKHLTEEQYFAVYFEFVRQVNQYVDEHHPAGNGSVSGQGHAGKTVFRNLSDTTVVSNTNNAGSESPDPPVDDSFLVGTFRGAPTQRVVENAGQDNKPNAAQQPLFRNLTSSENNVVEPAAPLGKLVGVPTRNLDARDTTEGYAERVRSAKHTLPPRQPQNPKSVHATKPLPLRPTNMPLSEVMTLIQVPCTDAVADIIREFAVAAKSDELAHMSSIVRYRNQRSTFAKCNLQDPPHNRAALAMASLDNRLSKIKPQVVPKHLSEGEFFSNYFSHLHAHVVARISDKAANPMDVHTKKIFKNLSKRTASSNSSVSESSATTEADEGATPQQDALAPPTSLPHQVDPVISNLSRVLAFFASLLKQDRLAGTATVDLATAHRSALVTAICELTSSASRREQTFMLVNAKFASACAVSIPPSSPDAKAVVQALKTVDGRVELFERSFIPKKTTRQDFQTHYLSHVGAAVVDVAFPVQQKPPAPKPKPKIMMANYQGPPQGNRPSTAKPAQLKPANLEKLDNNLAMLLALCFPHRFADPSAVRASIGKLPLDDKLRAVGRLRRITEPPKDTTKDEPQKGARMNATAFRTPAAMSASSYRFDIKNPEHQKAAVGAMQLDPRVSRYKSQLVPRQVTEQAYFFNYFSHVGPVLKKAIESLF